MADDGFKINWQLDPASNFIGYIVSAQIELDDWQIEALNRFWRNRFENYDVEDRIFYPTPRRPFRWSEIIDEWQQNWETEKLELTPEKLAEIRMDVLNALEVGRIEGVFNDGFGRSVKIVPGPSGGSSTKWYGKDI